jgi:hypothetical protein
MLHASQSALGRAAPDLAKNELEWSLQVSQQSCMQDPDYILSSLLAISRLFLATNMMHDSGRTPALSRAESLMDLDHPKPQQWLTLARRVKGGWLLPLIAFVWHYAGNKNKFNPLSTEFISQSKSTTHLRCPGRPHTHTEQGLLP